MAHDPSSPSKLLVPESRTSNFANLSCILVPDLSGIRKLDTIEHVLLLPSFWYEILVSVTWTENLGEVTGFQVLLNSLHPCSTRASWWSPPVLQGER